MAASTGKTGRYVYLTIEGVEVANVVGIGLDGRDAEEIDFTHLRSTGGFRELRQGFKDPGSINLTLHFDPTHATHSSATNGIEGLLNSGTEIDWAIVYTDAGWSKTHSGVGFIKSNNINVTVDGPIEASATIRVSGATTWS